MNNIEFKRLLAYDKARQRANKLGMFSFPTSKRSVKQTSKTEQHKRQSKMAIRMSNQIHTKGN